VKSGLWEIGIIIWRACECEHEKVSISDGHDPLDTWPIP
jgi:hypothetical protein